MSKRTPQETKEVGVKRLVEAYEKQNNTVADGKKRQEFEKLYEQKILPRTYEKH